MSASSSRGTIPIFPELRPYLEAAFDQAEPGTEHPVTIPSIRRDRYGNVRTRMESIIRRAGLTPWPKLFHNLRAIRETELAQQYPMHVVCSWLGHGQGVALKHYLRVTETDFDRAASTPTGEVNDQTALHSTDEGAAECAAHEAGEALQMAQQQAADSVSMATQAGQKTAAIQGLERKEADRCELLQNWAVPPAGFEPATC